MRSGIRTAALKQELVYPWPRQVDVNQRVVISLTFLHLANRITSDELLKYRNGLIIRRGRRPVIAPANVSLTMPVGQMVTPLNGVSRLRKIDKSMLFGITPVARLLIK